MEFIKPLNLLSLRMKAKQSYLINHGLNQDEILSDQVQNDNKELY